MAKKKRKKIATIESPGYCVDGCGACCDPIALSYAPSDLASMPIGAMEPANMRWIQNDLKHISRSEGLRRAPYFKEGGVTMAIVSGQAELLLTHFYECRHFDKQTRRCGNYEGRPPICRDFPWYGFPPDDSKAMPETCGYLLDVGVTPVPLPERRNP